MGSPIDNPFPGPRDESAFRGALDELRLAYRTGGTPEDLAHFKRISLFTRLSSLFGLALAFIPNPISVVLLAAGTFGRWTIVGHHACHRGLDRLPGCPEALKGRTFARGWRRLVDWMDWMYPDAWHHEHDVMHHSVLGELGDPDVAQRNAEWLRRSFVPMALRPLVVLVGSCIWKPLYYAPNTMNALLNTSEPDETKRHSAYDWRAWLPWHKRVWIVLWKCWLPYGLWRFVALPALFIPVDVLWPGALPFGVPAVAAALINLLLAEALTNFWSFWIIVPNHTGEDIWQFDTPVKGRHQYFLRQIVGSTNYRCGGDVNDFMQGWLNYQIEHHVFPDLAPRQYQELHPKLKALCEEHGVPFIQESIWVRCKKTMDILIGKTSMKTWPG